MSLDRAAERSTIGAVLLEPHRLERIAPWLQVDDFQGTAERQAYAALLDLRSKHEDTTPQSVEQRVRSNVPRGVQLANAPYLLTAMQETPSADHAAVYARMVLELSIRRRVVEGVVRLRQHAEGASTSAELNRVFADVDGVRRTVEDLHRRESMAADSHSVAPATDSNAKQLIRFPRHEELAAEQAAIFTLVEQPRHIDKVAKWLKPNDFGDDECGSLFQELVALRASHTPVDRLTVAWRAAKVGIEGPVSDVLANGRTDLVPAADPVICARRVLEQSVKAAVVATSEELERSVADASVNPTTAAYTRLNALWPQQRRLVKARVSAVGTVEA